MKCYECKFEHSDCKGDKTDSCSCFQKKSAINYPEKIRELEREIKGLELQIDLGAELCEVFRKDNARLKDKRDELADKLKKAIDENVKLKAELKQADEAYDIQGSQLRKALDKIGELKAENEKLKAECNKLQQWTLNDAKVRHGFELAIETLKKCKECDNNG